MMEKNLSFITVFYFEGLLDNPDMEKLLFTIFLALYIFIILGNGGIIFLITNNCLLHTPMYFFLKHLSFIDICYTSVIIPRAMSDLLAGDKSISYIACSVQMYFYTSFVITECLLLSIMSYDRYAAICKPLLYHIVMGRKTCVVLTVFCYTNGFFSALIHTRNVFILVYCDSNKIAHFFCDEPAVLALSCSDTSIAELVLFVMVGINGLISLHFVVISYTHIAFTILKMKSTMGREKAFATCSSHLLSTGILFGTLLYMYMRPTSSFSRDQDKVVAFFYAVVIPMLNPVIYSLRNKDVKTAFFKFCRLNSR